MLKRLVFAAALLVAIGSGLFAQGRGGAPAGPQKVTAIRAGRLIDPETGTTAANQIILVEGERIKELGPNVAIPPGTEVIDLSRLTVVPGFVDTHTHEAMTYKEIPENNTYYFTYVTDPTALRSIQAASNAMQLLASGFTVICDVGNNGLYADTALRQSIEQGWIPGPTVIPSGLIIGTTGGQFTPSPEMEQVPQHRIPGISRSQQPRRDREGGAREPIVRREGDQDLPRLQAMGLFGGRHQAVHRGSGEGRREGERARPDARRRPAGD